MHSAADERRVAASAVGELKGQQRGRGLHNGHMRLRTAPQMGHDGELIAGKRHHGCAYGIAIIVGDGAAESTTTPTDHAVKTFMIMNKDITDVVTG